jgi:hypothetical protein
MRTSLLAMIVVAGTAIAFPAIAQQQQEAAPSEQTRQQMHSNPDQGTKELKPATLESPDMWPTKTSRALPHTLRVSR